VPEYFISVFFFLSAALALLLILKPSILRFNIFYLLAFFLVWQVCYLLLVLFKDAGSEFWIALAMLYIPLTVLIAFLLFFGNTVYNKQRKERKPVSYFVLLIIYIIASWAILIIWGSVFNLPL